MTRKFGEENLMRAETLNEDSQKQDEKERFEKNHELEDTKDELRFMVMARKRAVTDCYRSEEFNTIINVLEETVKKHGFSGVTINENDKNVIGVNTIGLEWVGDRLIVFNTNQNKVDFGKDTLNNIKELFKIDKNFAREAMSGIIEHEKQHTIGLAGELSKKEIIKLQEAIDASIKNGKKDSKTINAIIDKIHKDTYAKTEVMAEAQRINETDYEDVEDFVNSEARGFIATQIIRRGMDHLKRIEAGSINFGLNELQTNFIKPALLERIIKRMNEMRQDLIEKQMLSVKDLEKSTELKEEK